MKKIATLATYQPRLIKILWDAVESLAPQVDEVHININPPLTKGDTHLLEAAQAAMNERPEGARIIINYMTEDLGDLAKFWPLTQLGTIAPEDLVLVCDDDWIYPNDYADTCLKHVTDGGGIISYGGKALNELPFTTFREAWKVRISQHESNEAVTQIDIPLTCVTAFQRRLLPYKLHLEIKYRNNGDVLLAKWARQAGVEIFVPPFQKGWLRYHPQMHAKETIWGTLNASKAEQEKLMELYTEVMNVECSIKN
jgi:hypothetical protein